MKEIKLKLKELAVLCVEKELNFNCSFFHNDDSSMAWSVYRNEDQNKITYISGVCEVSATWKDSSIERIEEVILKIEGLKWVH